jgi:hypothetical protein
MNIFCRLFGHTWIPETRAPSVRWNTTKDGHILAPTIAEQEVRHVELCRRCGLERPAPPRRHDADRPLLSAAAAGGEVEQPEEG